MKPTFKQFFEGDVIKGKFERKLKNKGMYKNPDIEVPKGFERFEVEKHRSGRVGTIYGIRKDGTRKSVGTSTAEVADALAAAYNAGGYTDKEIRKIPLGK